jgi:thioredoxin 1
MADRLTVYKCNVDDEGALAQRFGIMSIPTLILFKGGEAVHTMVGSVPKATLVAELEAHI